MYFQGVLPQYSAGHTSRDPGADPIVLDFPTRFVAPPAVAPNDPVVTVEALKIVAGCSAAAAHRPAAPAVAAADKKVVAEAAKPANADADGASENQQSGAQPANADAPAPAPAPAPAAAAAAAGDAAPPLSTAHLVCQPHKITCIAAGHDHALAVVDSRLYGLGSNKYNALHHAVPRESGYDCWTPLPEAGLLPGAEQMPVAEVACGMRHTLVRLIDGSVYSCGDNTFDQCGQTGRAARLEQCKWGKVALDEPVSRIFCNLGGNSSFALSGGRLYSWGQQQYGNLGHGTRGALERTTSGRADQFAVVSTPKLVTWFVGQRVHIADVACGKTHTVVMSKTDVFCFGEGAFMKLGNGNTNDEVLPRRLVFPQTRHLETLVAIGACDEFTVVLKHSQMVGAVIYLCGKDPCSDATYSAPTRINMPHRIDVPKGLSCGTHYFYLITDASVAAPAVAEQKEQQAGGGDFSNLGGNASAQNSNLGLDASASSAALLAAAGNNSNTKPTTEIYCYGRNPLNSLSSGMGLTGKERDSRTAGPRYMSTLDGLTVTAIAHLRWGVLFLCDDTRRDPGRALDVNVDRNDRLTAMQRRLIKRQRLDRLAEDEMNKKADPDFHEKMVQAFFHRCIAAGAEIVEREAKAAAAKLAKSAPGGKKSAAAAATAVDTDAVVDANNNNGGDDDDDKDSDDEELERFQRVEQLVAQRFRYVPVAAPETRLEDIYTRVGTAALRVGSHVRIWMTNIYALGTITNRDIPGLGPQLFEVTWVREDWDPEIMELRDEDETLDELNDMRWQKLWFPTWDEAAF